MSNRPLVSRLGGHTGKDDEAYALYRDYCVRMGLHSVEFPEYLKITHSIQPQPIAWGGAK